MAVKIDMKWVKKQWKKLGWEAREEKMKEKGWDTMKGKGNSGFNGKF